MRSLLFQFWRCGFGIDRGLFMRSVRLGIVEIAWSDVLIQKQLEQLADNLRRARDALRRSSRS